MDQETEEDLLHEFDDPLVTGKEFLTTGNIGYVHVSYEAVASCKRINL